MAIPIQPRFAKKDAVDQLRQKVKELSGEYNDNKRKIEENSKATREAGGAAVETADNLSTLQVAFGNLVAKGIALAISALKDFVASGIDYQNSLDSLNSTLGYVFGENGQALINHWSSTTASAMGISEEAAKRYAQQIGLIFDGSRKTGSQIAEMSTRVIQAGRDWASFANQDVDKLLSAIDGALRGNISSLGQYGIVLNRSDLDNRKYRGSIKGTWNELESAEKAQIIYNAILDKTSDALGHAAENQESYSGQTYLLKSNLTELSGLLAKDFLPTLTTILQETNDYLKENGEILSSLGTIIASVLNAFLQLVKVVGSLPAELILVIGYVALAITAFSKIEKGIGTVNTVFQLFGSKGVDPLIAKIIALVAAVSVLLFLILAIKEGTDKASQGLNGLGNAASQATSAAKNVKGYATGTNSAARGLAWVGENGPELVDFRGGERVYTATQSRQLAAAGATTGGDTYVTDHYTINVSGIQELDAMLGWWQRRKADSIK